MTDGYRKAALVLSSLAGTDRDWILDGCGPSSRPSCAGCSRSCAEWGSRRARRS